MTQSRLLPTPITRAAAVDTVSFTASHNLPTFLTRLVGRQDAVITVTGLLGSHRLLTLTGPGGCGKTRLACAVARTYAVPETSLAFPDGLWFIEFTSLTDPALVPQAIAAVFAVREERHRSLIETLCNALRDQKVLLLFDNCEHLIATVAAVADTLLRACPHLRILATSRESLRVPGEMTWSVPSLSLPEPADEPTALHLQASEAVQLFVDRVKLQQPTFALADGNAPAVATICRRLDGMPLALELAAAHAHVLTMHQLALRLDNALFLLTQGGRTVAPRHQTLRATLDWSYALLTDDERVVFRRLAVFAGGCDLATAETVCTGEGITRANVLALLAQLVEKSLIPVEKRHGTARYRLLETVRQYAEERLESSSEAEWIGHAHADWCRMLAEAAGVGLVGQEQQAWMERLLPEQDNIRKALRLLLDARRGAQGMRMCTDLWRFWWHQDHFTEGSKWLMAFLSLDVEEAAERAPATVRMDALFAAGRLMIGRGAHGEARIPLAEMLAIAREQDDMRRVSLALAGLGLIAFEQCALDESCRLQEEAITSARASGDLFALSQALHNTGATLTMRGEIRRARLCLDESLDLITQLGDRGNVARAQRWHGVLAIIEEDAYRARIILAEGLAFHHAGRSMLGIAECLEVFAALHALQHQHRRALRLIAAVAAIRDTIAVPCSLPIQHWLSGRLAPSYQTLGDATSAAIEQEGRTLTVEEAIVVALETEPEEQTLIGQTVKPSLGGLSAREREVVTHLVTGKTNRRIAEELYIAEKTVELHITHSLRKLGFRTRAELAVWASRNGLGDGPTQPRDTRA